MSTKERLLDAAEELFATRGYGDSSMRDITSMAEVNLASVNYHFGSKDGLLRATLTRRFEAVTRERKRLLDIVEAAAGERAPEVRAVLRAFIEPVFELKREHPHFPALMGRVMMENLFPLVGEDVRATLYPSLVSFGGCLSRAVPDIPPEEIRWRLFFTIGVFQFLVNGEPAIRTATGDDSEWNMDALVDRVVDFCEPGMRAPVSKRRAT